MGDRLKKSEQSVDDLGADLSAQQKLAEEEARDGMSKKMGWIEKTAQGDAGAVRSQFDRVYQAKAKELTKELLTFNQQLDKDYILKLQHTILDSLQSRAYLSMELTQKKTGPTDTNAKISQGINFMQSASIPSLVYQSLQSKHPEIAKAYLEDIRWRAIELVPDANGDLVPDLLPTLEHLKMKNPEITEEDWKVIVDQIKGIAEEGRDWVKDGTAMTLMALIPQNKRSTFVEKMLPEANYKEVLQTLLISGYLQVQQVTEVVEAKIEVLKKEGGNSEKIKKLQAFSDFAQGKELAKAQQQVEVAKVKEIKRHPNGRRFGQSNHARQLLTFKGLGGTLLAFNGMATIGANVLMNIHQPSQLLNNKSLAIGLAMTVGGLEVSNGMGGLMDKPSTNFAQGVAKVDEAMGGRKTKRDQMQEVYSQSFEHDILRHPKANKLYFQFAPEINAAYKAKVLKTHSSSVKLSLEEVGLNWAQIKKDFDPIDQAEVEACFSQWVCRMGKEGTGRKSVGSQREFIGLELRKKYEDYKGNEFKPPYQEWSQETAQTYLLEPRKPYVPEEEEEETTEAEPETPVVVPPAPIEPAPVVPEEPEPKK